MEVINGEILMFPSVTQFRSAEFERERPNTQVVPSACPRYIFLQTGLSPAEGRLQHVAVLRKEDPCLGLACTFKVKVDN